MNESGWRYPDSLDYVRRCGIKGEDSRGDLQICMRWYKGDTDRISLLEQGIKYYRRQYDRYNDWYKARYAYARGNWKDPSEWTELEKTFMYKFNQ